MQPKIKERICPACNGTGFPPITQPIEQGHKIYPVKCKTCDGKGKITEDNYPGDSGTILTQPR